MPTLKQKRASIKTVENLGLQHPKSKGQILRESGYAEAVVKNPEVVFDSKGFKEAVEELLPEAKMIKAHNELLDQTTVEYFVFPKQMEDEEIKDHVSSAGLKVITIRPSEKGKLAFYSVIDANARKAALDMGYKIKGTYAPDKSINLNLNNNELSKEGLDVDLIASQIAAKLKEEKT